MTTRKLWKNAWHRKPVRWSDPAIAAAHPPIRMQTVMIDCAQTNSPRALQRFCVTVGRDFGTWL
jgi:hypothetical protein